MKTTKLFLFFSFLCSLATYSQNRNINLLISDPTVGDTYTTRQFLFDLAKPTLRPEASVALDSIVTFMNMHKKTMLEIAVHNDTRQSKLISTALAEQRANSIFNYLVSKGIAKERLIAKGYADTKPLIAAAVIMKIKLKAERDSLPPFRIKAEQDSLHAINRRIEFKIIQLTP